MINRILNYFLVKEERISRGFVVTYLENEFEVRTEKTECGVVYKQTDRVSSLYSLHMHMCLHLCTPLSEEGNN